MDAIEIESPARLHLGFVDPSGSGARRFGSLGLALDGLSTHLRVSRATSAANAYMVASDLARPELERAAHHLEHLRRSFAYTAPLRTEILEAIPPHAGLGSGTQLALAMGYALARLSGRQLPVRQIAALTDRGARSGIGIGAFEQGGFVVDGGRGPKTVVPPVIARLTFPPAWRVVLIFDPSFVGLHGEAEVAAFRNLPPLSSQAADHLARLTLMQVLPGLAEADFAQFGPAISEIQATIGDHFAPAQGSRFASPAVANWLAWFAARGAICYGQSSWGPTGFVITASAEEARALLQSAKSARAPDDPVRFRSVAGRNAGARVHEFDILPRNHRPLNS
jgi:beta-ribofuranosylaminobenzene 5'-phosphate synthase